MQISASIVLYNHDHQVIRKLVESLVIQGTTCVYLVDNSPSNSEQFYVGLTKGVYKHRPQNPGFGASHNWAISQSLANGGQFHFVVNPDVYLGDNVILPMVNYMVTEKNIGMMMPKILNMDGSVQYLPKLLPTPISLLKRKFPNFFKKFVESYELRNAPQDKIFTCPILSGCFSLLNLEVIRVSGAYDERFFMYFEDFDLSRRISQKYKTVYFPHAQIIHEYDAGANKNLKLLGTFIGSAFAYFNKWGWFFDQERAKVNQETLSQFNS